MPIHTVFLPSLISTAMLLAPGVQGATPSVAFDSLPRDWPVANGPGPIVTGDFNNDGKQDLITFSESRGELSVLLGKGDGTFEPVINSPTGTHPYFIAVGDFNRDGKLDAVSADSGSSSLTGSVAKMREQLKIIGAIAAQLTNQTEEFVD